MLQSIKDADGEVCGLQAHPALWHHVALECLSALHEVHQSGYVHRDVHPGNLLFNLPTATGTGAAASSVVASPLTAADLVAVCADPSSLRLVLCDFGVSCLERLIQPNSGFVGTLHYASLTAHRESGRQSYRDDLQAAVFVLWKCWTGRLPWEDCVEEAEVAARKEAALAERRYPTQLTGLINYCEQLECGQIPGLSSCHHHRRRHLNQANLTLATWLTVLTLATCSGDWCCVQHKTMLRSAHWLKKLLPHRNDAVHNLTCS